ncbi:MAG: ATP-binding protein [Bacteroidota bacterium]
MQRYLLFFLVFIFLAVGMQIPVYATSQSEAEDRFYTAINMKDNAEKVNEFINLAILYRNISFDTALLCCDIAGGIAQQINYTEGEANALYKKSLIYSNIGSLVKAIEYAEDALHIAETIQDTLFMAKVHYALGNLFNDSDSIYLALDHFRFALKIFQQNKDTAKVAIVYSGLGNYYKNISAYDSSASCFHRYLEYSTPGTNPKNMAKILGSLGDIYLKSNDFENSRKYFELALEQNLMTNDINELATIYSRFGGLEVALVNHPAALIYYDLADSIYRKYKIKEGINNCRVNKSLLYLEQGKYEQASSKLDSALIYYKDENLPQGMIAAWLAKADIYRKQKYYDKALEYCDSSITLAEKTGLLKRLEQSLNVLISIYYDQGSWKKVSAALIRLHDVEDSIYNLNKSVSIADLMIKYEREKDQLKIINLEVQNLHLEYQKLQRTKQRNAFFYIGSGLVILAVALLFFFRYRAHKNQVIAEQQIKQLQEEKKFLAARFLVEGQESERKRIASAIHDSLGVLLSTSKMHITAIKDNNPDNQVLIDKATRQLEEASSEMRKISHNMMPGLLSKLGLCEALEDLFDTLNESKGLDARLEVLGPKNRLPENQEIMIYRVVQEMVNNTLKHAQADKVDLTLVIHPDELDLSYSDNGKGFDIKEIIRKKTMGVQSIRSRVKFLDGIINIKSSPGNGSVYRISIPLETNRGLTSV